MKRLPPAIAALLTLLSGHTAVAEDFDTHIPMQVGSATTYYVKAVAGNLEAMDFMVDTGSGYTTINEETLAELKRLEQAHYLRDLRGILANGTEMVVPVYRLAHFNIGGGCPLNNVEAAVFPGKTRQILGLSALKQAGPFIFSFDPPNLILSNCPQNDLLASATEK
ncbi:retropepsin-like aspartic protease family protein [Sedimenticola sp.]|uniref:retropepsin-like aspartic protease family protein n=1 Tax=Sedimenticola sp. TaxID=1940285 RepID=UPI003D112115